MKNILMILSFMICFTSAWANSINVKTPDRNFHSYTSILSSDINDSEKLLRVYMEDTMNCNRVRLNLNILREDGLFKRGIFNLTLNADCGSNVTNVQLDVEMTCEPTLILQFLQNGQPMTKKFYLNDSAGCDA